MLYLRTKIEISATVCRWQCKLREESPGNAERYAS